MLARMNNNKRNEYVNMIFKKFKMDGSNFNLEADLAGVTRGIYDLNDQTIQMSDYGLDFLTYLIFKMINIYSLLTTNKELCDYLINVYISNPQIKPEFVLKYIQNIEVYEYYKASTALSLTFDVNNHMEYMCHTISKQLCDDQYTINYLNYLKFLCEKNVTPLTVESQTILNTLMDLLKLQGVL